MRRSDEIDAAVRAAVTDGHGLYALDETLLGELEPDLILTQELCRVCAVAYPRVVEAARMAGEVGADDRLARAALAGRCASHHRAGFGAGRCARAGERAEQ